MSLSLAYSIKLEQADSTSPLKTGLPLQYIIRNDDRLQLACKLLCHKTTGNLTSYASISARAFACTCKLKQSMHFQKQHSSMSGQQAMTSAARHNLTFLQRCDASHILSSISPLSVCSLLLKFSFLVNLSLVVIMRIKIICCQEALLQKHRGSNWAKLESAVAATVI